MKQLFSALLVTAITLGLAIQMAGPGLAYAAKGVSGKKSCPVAACKKYHIYAVPGGEYYSKILSTKSSLQCFKTIREAEKAGFKKS